MKINKNRWLFAQDYEKEWWSKRVEFIDFDFYKNYAADLLEFGEGYIKITKDTTILEIGSGAGGTLTFLTDSENRYAIDPLEYYYSTVIKFIDQRDKSVKYSTEKGENLPFPDKMFDLIIMDNVLDHCDNPLEVMNEIDRVIKKDGLIYFRQNTYHLWGKIVRYLMEIVTIDKGHPHTFSKNDLKKLFITSNFMIIKNKRLGYYFTWKKELFSKATKEKLKAILFVTRDRITYLLKKR
ncbi:MAG: class I SAM-dependent methyltransferase [bacterium]